MFEGITAERITESRAYLVEVNAHIRHPSRPAERCVRAVSMLS